MNKAATSREQVLLVGKEILGQSGIQSLNMREVARRCGVSVGAVYNYFPSKSDLVVAVIEAIWVEIVHEEGGCSPHSDFIQTVAALFTRVREGCQKYPSFFSVHSMSMANLDKEKGREAMGRYFAHVKTGLLDALGRDRGVRPEVFAGDLSADAFVDFVFSNLLQLWIASAPRCDTLLEILLRVLYKTEIPQAPRGR